MEQLSKNIEKVRQKAAQGSQASGAQDMDHAKLPPQAPDLEEAVLGAMLLEKEAVNDAIDILHPDVFYKEAHKQIFEAIKRIFERSEPIDILTVTNELRTIGQLDVVGGSYFVSQLTNRVASGANVEYHARIIVQKYLQRRLIEISGKIIKDAYEDTTDVFELLDKAESSLFEVAEGNIRKNFDNIGDLVKDAVKGIEEAKHQEGGVNGVESGFLGLDRLTSGWQPSDLIILAARPGMGKTAFVLSMARNTAIRFGRGVGIFSLEMSSEQLTNRLIASETELSAEKLRKGDIEEHEWEQLNNKVGTLMESPIYIDDTPALSVFELRAKCRRLVAQQNVELIIVDYLQLMTAGGSDKGNREQEISTISRSIKSIAKELNVPFIALSQLNRTPELRGSDKRPQLSDLRESGAIEQDADIVSFIYRPEYYGLEEWDYDGSPTKNQAEIIVAKHRNGALNNVRLRFIPQLAKFEDMDEDPAESAPPPLSANDRFDEESNTITRGSKMNEDDPLPGGDEEEEGGAPSPF